MKTTLSNLPTYFLSLFSLPMTVANCFEKLHCDFLRVGLGEEFKFHFVSYSEVCSPILECGVGIRNLLKFNCALLGKWFWRYVHEREAWWSVVVDSKFGSSWDGWCSNEPFGSY
jgi:hypothetical protein